MGYPAKVGILFIAFFIENIYKNGLSQFIGFYEYRWSCTDYFHSANFKLQKRMYRLKFLNIFKILHMEYPFLPFQISFGKNSISFYYHYQSHSLTSLFDS